MSDWLEDREQRPAPFSFHIRSLNNVLIGFEPVSEMVREIIDAIEATLANINGMQKEHDKYLAGLPTTKEELVEFVKERFVLERGGKQIIIKHGN